ncbi:MAG: hypothetical protein ACM3H9_11335 [Rhodospirillaceae bacterium]
MAGSSIEQRLTRREFNAASLSALFVGMTVWVSGCGGGSSASPSSPTSSGSGAPPTGSGDKMGSISANHGHVATVTSAVLQAGGAVTLHIQGSADHDHTVDLTQAEVGQIAGNTRVTKGSSADAGHTHNVTFN